MRYKKREIPWDKVVHFHAEIAHRDEKTFFALPLNEPDSEKWSSLAGFYPASLSGNWTIPQKTIISQALLQAVHNGYIDELFLGGPCWFKYRRDERQIRENITLYWQPVIYRAVRVELKDDNLKIIPLKAGWEVSPLVIEFMDQKEIQPTKPLDELLPNIIEKASLRSEKEEKDLTKCFIEELGRIIPELGHELNREFPKHKVKSVPSKWVLFTTPDIMIFNKNLINDYEVLEKQLENNPEQVGGLKLLEDIPFVSESDMNQVEVLPFVPLNTSQHEAVKCILGSKPVTVISGPPGCGKSQVVVSVLLNAWAKGKSVLFASTINQAVDVVREKFEPLESDFPIAIRAGRKSKNNIKENFRRILNSVAAGVNKSNTDSIKTAEKIKKLKSKKNELLNCLESKIPQRVNQEIRSALNAYSRYKIAVKELSDAREQYVQEIKNLNYDIDPDEFTAMVTKPLREWLEKIKKYHSIIEQDSHDKYNLLKSAENAAEARNRAVQKAGLDPSTVLDWNWLTSGPSYELIEAWLENYRYLLSQPLEQRLAPIEWDNQFNEWDNEIDARNWNQNGLQLVKNIKSTCSELSTELTELKNIKNQLNKQLQIIKEAGIPEDIQIDPNLLSEWLNLYAAEITHPTKTFDFLPWSEHSKLNRKLRSIENQIRAFYPLSIWQKIGKINETGRKSLSEIIEKTSKWIIIRDIWDKKKTLRDEIESRFGALRKSAIELSINEIPDSIDLSEWLKFAETIKSKANVADAAAIAWNKRVIAEQTKKELKEIAHRFETIASGVPIKEAWIKSLGHVFNQSVLSLIDNPTQSKIVFCRTALYNNKSIKVLIEAWSEARKAEIEHRKYTNAIEKIPTETSRINDWWDEKPLTISLQKADISMLPDDDDELWKHLKACEKIDENWKRFKKEILEEKEKQCDDELNWAINLLKKALETVPEGKDKTRIRETVQPLIDGVEKNWPIDDLSEVFKAFNPDRIKDKINQIDRELEILSFALAKDNRLEAIANDIEAQEALEILLYHYRNNHDSWTKEISPHLFTNALRAAPIWITTAQSSQSIPMQPEIFDLLVIDEATQCTLTNILPMIYRAKRIAVIGDPEQLPAIPTISSRAEKFLAEKFNIIDEILEFVGHVENDVYKTTVRCLPRRHADVISLVEHYRSHPLIIGFANQHIYQKKLHLNKDQNQSKQLPFGVGVYGMQVNGYCKRGRGNKSWVNELEKNAVCELVEELKKYKESDGFSIGVVTPFSSQRDAILDKLSELGLEQGVTVGTAHTFQGDARDVMIFSPVVAKGITEGGIRFVEEPPNLINVAVTRGKEALFVVGDLDYCGQQKGILGKLIDYIKTVSELRKTSPYELELFSWMILQGWEPQIHVQVGDIEVDFILNNYGIKLVIEVDGETIIEQDGNVKEIHHEKTKDDSRDAFLNGQGYKVLHFKTRAIRETPFDVIHDIAKALEFD